MEMVALVPEADGGQQRMPEAPVKVGALDRPIAPGPKQEPPRLRVPVAGQAAATARTRAAPTTHAAYWNPSASTAHTDSALAELCRLTSITAAS